MNNKEEIESVGMPTILNRDTGEYEPIFSEKQKDSKVTVIKEMVTVIMPEQVSAYLQFMGIKTLDLGNKEHVETLKAFFLPEDKQEGDVKQVAQPEDLATSEVVQPEESVLKAVHAEVEKELKKEVKKVPQKTDKKAGKKTAKKK